MKNKFLSLSFLVVLSLCVKAQNSPSLKKDTSRFKFSIERADDWTNLFYRNSGWFGADGIFSIPLSGVDKNNNEGNDSTILLFGDTYIGEVKDGKPLPGNIMVNNTIAYIKGND